MRAAICRSHGAPLSIERIRVALPGPDHVRVDIHVCAICHSDITYIDGGWGGPTPAIYGHEAAGVVESIGKGVTGIVPGDRVIVGLLRSCGECFHCRRGEENLCNGAFPQTSPFTDANGHAVVRGLNTGAFATQTVVHKSQVVPVPDDLPLAPASLLACGVLTGFGAVVNTASVPSGSSVAIIGVGGVGLSALQGAVNAGAGPIVAVDVVPRKLAFARELGATHVFDANQPDQTRAVREATSGVGPDFVFVTVGVRSAIEQALAMVRRGGTVVFVGMPPTGLQTEIEVTNLADGSQTIKGSKMGSARMSRDVPRLIDLYRSGDLELNGLISNVYPLEEINEAIAEVKAGEVVRNLIQFT